MIKIVNKKGGNFYNSKTWVDKKVPACNDKVLFLSNSGPLTINKKVIIKEIYFLGDVDTRFYLKKRGKNPILHVNLIKINLGEVYLDSFLLNCQDFIIDSISSSKNKSIFNHMKTHFASIFNSFNISLSFFLCLLLIKG